MAQQSEASTTEQLIDEKGAPRLGGRQLIGREGHCRTASDRPPAASKLPQMGSVHGWSPLLAIGQPPIGDPNRPLMSPPGPSAPLTVSLLPIPTIYLVALGDQNTLKTHP